MRTINISGTASISKQPECMNVKVDVNSLNQESVEKANEIADHAINELKEYCKKRGIKTKDVKLLEYRNTPIYQYVDKEVWNADKTQRTMTKERVFMGYQTTAILTFSFKFNMKTAAIIFSELGDIKNISYNMEYALKDPEKEKHKVLDLAVKNARATADVLAAAAGTKVVAVENISYGEVDSYSPREYRCAKNMALLETACAIQDLGVEDLTVSETVSIVFEIE
jgi:uncharacterized protein YggE